MQNSFSNSTLVHMFYPNFPPGYEIVQNPTNVIYLPINTQFISDIILKIIDQKGKIVNFIEELFLKKVIKKNRILIL